MPIIQQALVLEEAWELGRGGWEGEDFLIQRIIHRESKRWPQRVVGCGI